MIIREIAKALKRSPSIISREIKRNKTKTNNKYSSFERYFPIVAQNKYEKRRTKCKKIFKFNHKLIKYVESGRFDLKRKSKYCFLTLVERKSKYCKVVLLPDKTEKNGLLREYYPKGMDLSEVDEEELELVQLRLNNKPRKCINFKTPNEELFGNLY